MYETFGAVVVDPDVEFRLFFPDAAKDPSQYQNGGLPRITEIRVTGTFQATPWDLQTAPLMTPTDQDRKSVV